MTFDIEKRAEELLRMASEKTSVQLMGIPLPGTEWAIQLAREAADARAEEIADRLQHSLIGCLRCGEAPQEAANIARSTISKAETREQRLEKALRYYATPHVGGPACETSPGAVARAALEEK